MTGFRYSKIVLAFAVGLLVSLPFVVNFRVNSEQLTPSPTPAHSPTPTPSVTPTLSPTPTPTPGTQNFHQWGSVTLFNGLPSDNVRSIAQTPDGVMWFGTDSGLARFDGRTIQAVPLGDAGLAKVFALKIGLDGRLWIGTEKGAFLYTDQKFFAVAGSSQFSINAVLPGEPTLLSTGDGPIYRVSVNADGSTQTFEAFQDTPGRVTTIAGSGGKYIVGTAGDGRHLYEVRDGITSDNKYDQPSSVNALAQDTTGNAWLGGDAGKTGSGLYSLNDLTAPKKLGKELGNVLSIEPDANGGAWVGTAKNGLYKFHGAEQVEHFTFENTSGGLRSNIINSIFLDREGVVWLGTNRGVCRYDGSSPFIRTVSDNANSNFVRTLYCGHDGRILAGTNRGLFVFDGEKWSAKPGLPQKAIYAISEDKGGNLLFGGPAGVFNSSGRQSSDGDTRAFAAFRGKTYAAVFERGLQDLNDAKSSGILSGTNPTALYSAGETLWIGTSDGSVYSFDGSKTNTDAAFAVLRGAAIRKITRSDDSSIWIAGSKGIFRYSEGALESVVANYDVRDLITDRTDIWAATVNGGLLHIGRDDLFGWIVSDLNVEQGMPSQQVFALLKSENGIMIGTNRGVVNYTPGQVVPKVVVSRVLSRRLYQPEEWRKTIGLEYPENSMLVEVAGQSSRTFPEQFQYAYLLKNAGGDLIEKRLSHDSQYSPSNLKPGEYTIEARAFNKDLFFSEPVAIHFTVPRSPFPWTATALGALLVIALIALIWAMIERRRIAERNAELAAARFDLANEAERERSRIARDLHDQTLADLRNLMMMSDMLSPPNAEFRSEIESVSTEIRRICEDLSPSVLENVGLVAALEFLLTRTAEGHKFTTSDDANELVKFPVIVQLHIYRIAQEILTNINHHSDATHVEMSVEVFADARFLLTIRDNGSIFDPEAAAGKGRGIANIRSRAALIGANIEWRESGEGGNLFSMELTSAV